MNEENEKARFYVVHTDGADCGYISPEFQSYAEARAKADEWNKEIEGHKVLTITKGTR